MKPGAKAGGSLALFPPALGADGRLFLGAGRRLLCLSQSGTRLWSLELPAGLALAPATDGAGRPLLGLEDGSLLLLSPYGELLARLSPGSPARALGAFGSGSLGELAAAALAAAPPAAPVPGSRPLAAAGLADGRLLLLGGRGELLRELRPSPEATVSLASDGRMLYGLSSSGLAYAVSDAGELRWKCETGLAEGGLELFSERLEALGKGRALSLSLEGEVFREAQIRNAASAALVSPSGLLFSAGEDWVLAAYRFESPLGPPLSTRAGAYGRGGGTEPLLFDFALRESGRQLALLRDIVKSLESGRIGSGEPRAAALAASIALGEPALDYPGEELRFRGNPLPRARAAAFLGRLGSPEDAELLIRVLRNDEDSAVRAAALRALGAIAVDPEGETGRAILVTAGRGGLPEELALALAETIEAMSLRSGLPPSAEALRVLIELSAAPYGAAARDRAFRAMRRLAESPEN